MTELINWAILTVAAASLIFAVVAYRAVMRTTGRVDTLINKLPDSLDGILTPQFAGATLRHMLTDGVTSEDDTPVTVPRVINAMVAEQIEFQKPNIMAFMEKEGIPLLAKIGGGQVAEDARLARAAKNLPGGAGGLQGLMGLITSPSKKSGIGDLMQYLPLVKQFMSQSPGNGPNTPPEQPQRAIGGGRIGGT